LPRSNKAVVLRGERIDVERHSEDVVGAVAEVDGVAQGFGGAGAGSDKCRERGEESGVTISHRSSMLILAFFRDKAILFGSRTDLGARHRSLSPPGTNRAATGSPRSLDRLRPPDTFETPSID